MDDKAILAGGAVTLQRMPDGTTPSDELAKLVIANNRLVVEASAALMTLDTVPQPPRPDAAGGDQ